MARLGLRASEVVQLRLEDLDWRNATVRVRARKTGHGALLPLTAEVGAALADYLQHGRPDTPARQVFVLHRLRAGAPISGSIVGRAVDNALRRAGMDAPIRGANLLRHSLATDLLGHGASLREIADLLGHSLAGHHPDLRRGRCRGVAGGRAAVAAGDVMTGHVSALVDGLHRVAPWPGLPLAQPGACAAGLRPVPGPGTGTTARSRWSRAWTGRHRPPRQTRATRPGG